MGEAKETIEQRTGSCPGNPCRNDFWCPVEGIDEHWRKQEEDDTDGFNDKTTCQYAKPHTFAYTVIFPCPKVLGNEGGHGHGEGSNWQEDKAFYFGIGTNARNNSCTKGVVVGLDQDVGKVDDAVLHGGRETKADNF